MSWEKVDFETAVKDITGGNRKFQGVEYNAEGRFPIVDQGEGLIAGYTDEIDIVQRAKEVIVFGDHTKSLKYVDFDFCLGADGVKVLQPYDQLDSKFLYYYLKTIKLPNVGYSRHYKFLKNRQIPLPPLPIQQRIAEILDAADALKRKDQELLKKYDELAQAIFIDMFGDPVGNEKGWEVGNVIDYCDCIVPGRDKPKSFTGDIPWITTDDLLHLGTTEKSKKGLALSLKEITEVKAKLIPESSVIITCVGDLGVVSVNRTAVIINQQLHAFQCLDTLKPFFLMYNLSFRKDYMYKMASSTTVAYMNKTVCNSIPIIKPPISLQIEFERRIALINSQKSNINGIVSENLFNSLIQKAFKGELVS